MRLALAPDLAAAAEQGTLDVVDLATRRRRRHVRATRTPGAPDPAPLLTAASLANKAAQVLALAHDTDPAFSDVREESVREALRDLRASIAVLGALAPLAEGGDW